MGDVFPLVTTFTETNPRGRTRSHTRLRNDDPGTTERRAKRAEGLGWCRRCADWLALDGLRSGLCKPHRNELYRENYAANPAAIRARTKARKRDLEAIPEWFRLDMLDEFGGLCAYGCGEPATTTDHVWPVALGGLSIPGNLVPACLSCNVRKSDKHPGPWVDRGAAAFPSQWGELAALAALHDADQWGELCG